MSKSKNRTLTGKLVIRKKPGSAGHRFEKAERKEAAQIILLPSAWGRPIEVA